MAEHMSIIFKHLEEGVDAGPDPIERTVARWLVSKTAWEVSEEGQPEQDAWAARQALADQIQASKPKTLAGLYAQFIYLKANYGDFILESLGPDDGLFFDQMLGSLERMVRGE